MNTKEQEVKDIAGISLTTAALQKELSSPNGMECCSQFPLGEDGTVQVCAGQDSLWVMLRRPGSGGFAFRAAYSPGMPPKVVAQSEGDTPGSTIYRVEASAGTYVVEVRTGGDNENPVLRCTTRLTPSQDLLLPFWPRDLYPLGGPRESDPVAAQGEVLAAQRGLNAALVYMTLGTPSFGTLLYLQNLTALNDYFRLTDTKPDGVVGGDWPELGYQMPICEDRPLPAGREVILSDAVLTYCAEKMPEDVRDDARQFLDLLATAYRAIERPETEYHDWPHLAERTLRHLDTSPKVMTSYYGHRFVRPYVDAEYPDSMVQLTVLTPIKEYAAWQEKEQPLADDLRSGVKHFFDKKLNVIRRYLPNVGEDKDANEVDSWYMYHPLINLGRLAKEFGDGEARELFLTSLEYGIKVARHFKYEWPIQYDIETLAVIKRERKPGDPGQSDVGGIYAYAMIQAWELTQEKRYLDEATAAIQKLKGMRFELEYQANITSWGATACLRLWRITGDPFYRDQSFVFLANLFHNCILWESEIDAAEHYRMFLGLTCLHDGPYMALYECFESYASICEYLEIAGEELPDSVTLLLTEYNKYTLTRAWYYYPENIPKAILATDIRNGHIDRSLAFPLEDLYADGQPAGQVGQEVYGSGAAFVFATRAYHRQNGVPFLLYSEYPLAEYVVATEADETGQRTTQTCAKFRLRGADGFASRIRLIPTGRKALPAITVAPDATGAGAEPLAVSSMEGGAVEFFAPAGKSFCIYWE
jgi:hypothetical protein